MSITDEYKGVSQLLDGKCPGCPKVYAYDYMCIVHDHHTRSSGSLFASYPHTNCIKFLLVAMVQKCGMQ